jgi:hypothetical protein
MQMIFYFAISTPAPLRHSLSFKDAGRRRRNYKLLRRIPNEIETHKHIALPHHLGGDDARIQSLRAG